MSTVVPQRRYKRRFNALKHVLLDPSSSDDARGEAARDLVQLGSELIDRLPNNKNRVQVLKEPRIPRKS